MPEPKLESRRHLVKTPKNGLATFMMGPIVVCIFFLFSLGQQTYSVTLCILIKMIFTVHVSSLSVYVNAREATAIVSSLYRHSVEFCAFLFCCVATKIFPFFVVEILKQIKYDELSV